MPGRGLSQNSLRKGGSVPSCCVTSYCSRVSRRFNSVSLGFVWSFIARSPTALGGSARGEAPRYRTARPATATTAVASRAAALMCRLGCSSPRTVSFLARVVNGWRAVCDLRVGRCSRAQGVQACGPSPRAVPTRTRHATCYLQVPGAMPRRPLPLLLLLVLTRTALGADTWWRSLGPVLAPVSAVAVNPQHPERIYAGTWSGFFTSLDGGSTWGLAQQGLPPAGPLCTVQQIAFDAGRRRGRMYVGAGNRLAASQGCGAFKGRGLILRWRSLGLDDTGVGAIAVAPSQPEIG